MPKTLVLLWGWNNADHSYRPVFDTTPAGWQLKTIDYHHVIPDADVSKLPDQMLKFLDQNGLNTVTLAGHSMGGALAIRFAAKHPDHVDRLILANSAGAAPNQSFVLSGLKLLSEHLRSSRRPTVQDLQFTFKNPPHSLKMARFAHAVDIKVAAQALIVPTTIIWGDADRLYPIMHGQQLHRWITGSQLHVLTDKGHDWISTNPEVLWEHVSRRAEMN